MADEEQLTQLRHGVAEWNKWRITNPLSNVDLNNAQLSLKDLSGANLSRADLSGADLSDANLGGADLSGADLRLASLNRANLCRADLSATNLRMAQLKWANLSEATLKRANFRGADLRRVNLSKANLREAYLISANILDANFSGTDVRKAVFLNTVLGNIDLSTAMGLEECEHFGPSIVDYRTLQRSGTLPLNFLRGCGLPDLLIEYIPSLFNRPIQYHSTFISYSSQDDEFARRIYADLQSNGIRCWFAPEDMKIGDKIRSRIDEMIHVHQKLLLILSEASINSDWVEKEVETAFENERNDKQVMLFPIRIDDAPFDRTTGWVGDIKRSRHIGDFRNWRDPDNYTDSFNKLLKDLKIKQITELT